MLLIASALIPVFLLILAGAAMRHWRFPGEALWQPLDRLIYYVLFPALLIRSLDTAQLAGIGLGPLAAALLLAIVALTGALLALRPLVTSGGSAFTSVYQGALRFSTFIGLGAVAALYGPTGVTAFAFAIALCVPILNVLCVMILARYASAHGPLDWRSQVRLLATNPLILACLFGIFLNLTGLALPGGVGATLDLFAKASIPLGLLAVGAGLEWHAVRSAGNLVALSTLARLVAMPVLLAITCRLTGVDGVERNVAILWGALPTASSAYILARQMGGDAPLMAAIITAQTLAAFATIPLVLTLLR